METTSKGRKVGASIPSIDDKQLSQGAFITLTLDTRKPTKSGWSVAVRVAFAGKSIYFRTGVALEKDYYISKFVSATRKNQQKADVLDYFDKIVEKATLLDQSGVFTLSGLQEAVNSKKSEVIQHTLFGFWERFAESRNTPNTRAQYKLALHKFQEWHPKDIALVAVNNAIIRNWKEWMEDHKITVGKNTRILSVDARNAYLRVMRAVMNGAVEDGIIQSAPSFKKLMDVGNNRADNHLKIEEILKLWEWWNGLSLEDKKQGAGYWVGQWFILYTMNGFNAKDMAEIRWNKTALDEEFPELSFIRSKVNREGIKPKPINVPIIQELKLLLDVYASEYKEGSLVFPYLYGVATKDNSKANRLIDFSHNLTKGVKKICEDLGIGKLTPAYARASFATTLVASHRVPMDYVDGAMGHILNHKILGKHYLGRYASEEDSRYFNSKLFKLPRKRELKED